MCSNKKKPSTDEEIVLFAIEEIKTTLDKNRLYSNTEFYQLLQPFFKRYKFPEYKAIDILVNLKIMNPYNGMVDLKKIYSS
ncbi:hypothetical protein [Maribacter stanieri]|uniref:hypothetical protein n=1 Tax=Maribacter stanieri TaxID=440514 RepID=UPI0030DA02A0